MSVSTLPVRSHGRAHRLRRCHAESTAPRRSPPHQSRSAPTKKQNQVRVAVAAAAVQACAGEGGLWPQEKGREEEREKGARHQPTQAVQFGGATVGATGFPGLQVPRWRSDARAGRAGGGGGVGTRRDGLHSTAAVLHKSARVVRVVSCCGRARAAPRAARSTRDARARVRERSPPLSPQTSDAAGARDKA